MLLFLEYASILSISREADAFQRDRDDPSERRNTSRKTNNEPVTLGQAGYPSRGNISGIIVIKDRDFSRWPF